MSGRRRNNEGTIRKRSDGRWEGRVLLENGKHKCFYGKTEREVLQQVKQAIRDVDSGLPVTGDRQTVAQYLETWLETVQHQIESSSLRRYMNYVRLHIIPGIGKVLLSKLTAQQVQTLYARLLSKGLSSTTVHLIHGAFHSALDDALRLGLIQRNVTDMVRAPRRNDKEMRPLTEEQAKTLLAAVVGDAFEAIYVLALSTGMREGEIFALCWQDVDLERSTLYVLTTLKEAGKQTVIGKPKTKTSRRRIALSRVAVEKLREHRRRQEEAKHQVGDVWDDSLDLVFPNLTGGKMIADNFVKRHFKKKLREVGIPDDIRFHDLRHTCATLLLSRGVNIKVVSEMLGHADVTITLRTYAHVLPNMQQSAADMADVLFEGE